MFIIFANDYSSLYTDSSIALQQNYIAKLHTFVDTSEDAYAAVSYFRIEFSGNVDVRLVVAKAKVAPLRPLSVPRLELQAAVIGARLMNWVGGNRKKFKQFVMFRIDEILKSTDASDWR